MKLSELKRLIKEIKTDEELEQEIEQYFKVQKELDQITDQYKDIIENISNLDKSLKTRFKKIQEYMDEHDIQEKKVKSWVAKLKVVAAYKRVAPDYKELWLEALKKVNEATRRVMQLLETNQIEAKKIATKIELELVNESVLDYIKKLWANFKSLLSGFNNYKNITNNLPKLDTI